MARWHKPVLAAVLVASFVAVPGFAQASESASASPGAGGIRTVATANTAGAPASADAAARAGTAGTAGPTSASHVVYDHLTLPDGRWARVYSDGLAEIRSADDRGAVFSWVPLRNADGGPGPGDGAAHLPPQGQLIMDLARAGALPYAAQQVLVALQPGVSAPEQQSVPRGKLGKGKRAPSYTSASGLNAVLAGLGSDRMTRMFQHVPRHTLTTSHAEAEAATGRPLVDISRLYAVHITQSSVPAAVEQLRRNPNVAYAAPDWTVSTLNTAPVPVPSPPSAARPAIARPLAAAGSEPSAAGVPTNFTLTSSAQSLLNRPAMDVVPAFSLLAQHGQLPGEGEIITNVSLGDLTDASAAANSDDACHFYASAYGPTTIVQNGQRYIDWPSMPLIPTYTADSAGTLDGQGETCGQDPNLVEVGLDFSMMAPLPHADQRPGREGSGLTDLLGIAPGAQYRLVVPKNPGGAVTDVDAAFLAAANQQPAPSVITASLGFGLDQDGFASRYLEEDPVTESVIASIVHAQHIVVCVSAGDGLRTFTNAPVPPSGGSVATDVAPPGQQQTDLNDVAFSSAVSRVYDSGAIDVGGSTLNDIFSAPPNDPRNAAFRAQQAFPATRYNGGRLYSSGFGSRVNVSAPGDNVLAMSHPFGGDAQSVQMGLNGGTSASAPEVAAAAAVVLQVARLTGNTTLPGHPTAVRDFLQRTGAALPGVPQSDLPLSIGPQVDVGNAVETLLSEATSPVQPGVARIAVAQRQAASALGGSFTTITDPAAISLSGRLVDSLITIAPDWLGLVGKNAGATFRLAADTGPRGVLARTAWARLYPTEILGAAGLPVTSAQPRTVPLIYTASVRNKVVATARFSLTFGPTDGTVQSAPAPIVDPVVHGSTLHVRYDLTGLTGATNPTLVVSNPGRVESATGLYFRPSYTVPLTGPSGTVDVPVSALPGGGIYGVGVQDSPGGWFSRNDSTFTFTRVAPTGDRQPAVPLVSSTGWSPGHYAELPYGGTFTVQWDVHQVPKAQNAVIEISAPGRTVFHSYNPFNNPNGSERDANGHDSGSVAYIPVTGRTGSITLRGTDVGLVPTMNHVIRVLATRGGQVVGEASGVSTISMDGVRPTDGGNLADGFAVNASGTDGFVTSNQTLADGTHLGSVQTFDQASAAVTGTPRSSADDYNTLYGGCPGIYHGDVGLYEDYDPATGDDNYRLLNTVTSGADGGTWTPPDSAGGVLCGTTNQAAPDSAFLSGTGGTQPNLKVFTSDVGANTFGTPIDITPGLAPGALTIVAGIGQDSQLDQAVVPVVDAFAPDQPGRIVLADLAQGTVSEFASATTYFASGVAVDSQTHRAIVTSNDTFGTYDLTGRTGTAHTAGGGGYQHPAADPDRSVFVMQEVASPDFSGEAPNNNTMSSIVVVDENGNLLQRIEKFNFYDTYLLDMGSYVQLNPATGTGFTFGYQAAQLQPFRYGGTAG